MKEALVKTHLIITDIHEEYEVKWCGRIIGSNPELKNGLPIFIIIGNGGRIELNTVDMKRIEKTAKLLAIPKGRKAVETDKARIYIKEKGGNEKFVGYVAHSRVKKFAPMYDRVGYR